MLTSILLMGAIPVVQCAGLLALDDLSAARTASCLLLQALCTTRRGRLQRPRSISILQGCLPVGVAWVGGALDLARTLGFHRLLETDEVLTSRGSSQAPGFAQVMGKGALGDPAPGGVRVAERGPAREPSPDEAVALRTRFATADVAGGVRPAPEDGVERSDALGRCGTGGVVTEGVDRRWDGVPTGLPRRHLQRGRLASRSGLFASGLPSAVTALSARGHDRLVRGEPHPAGGSKGRDRRQDRLCETLP